MRTKIENMLSRLQISLNLKQDADLNLALDFIEFIDQSKDKDPIFFTDVYRYYFESESNSKYRRNTIKTQFLRYGICNVGDIFSISLRDSEQFKKIKKSQWFIYLLKCLHDHGFTYD